MNSIFDTIRILGVAIAAIQIMETHLPGLLAGEWPFPKPVGLNRQTLTKAQKSRLNRYIRHKRKKQYWRTHLSIALEWHRKEVGL